MRVPISWLREFVDVPAAATADDILAALVAVGFEEEDVHTFGVTGPVVVGQVLEFTPEPQTNGKTINWCQVDVGEAEPRGIVCGAHNFAVGDKVVVSLPGRDAARAVPDRRAQDLRPRVRRHDRVGARARSRRGARRHPAAGRARPRSEARRRMPRRCSASTTSRSRSTSRPTAATRSRSAASRASTRTRRARSSRDPASPRSRAVAAPELVDEFPVTIDDTHGHPRPLRRHRVHHPRGQRRGCHPSDAGLDGRSAHACGHPLDLAARRHHQLRHVGARPAHARLRPRQGRRRAHGSPRDRGREARHARRPDPHALAPKTSSSPMTRARSGSPASWAARPPRSRMRRLAFSSRPPTSTRCRSRERHVATSCRARHPSVSSAASTRRSGLPRLPASVAAAGRAGRRHGRAARLAPRRLDPAGADRPSRRLHREPHRRRLHRRRDRRIAREDRRPGRGRCGHPDRHAAELASRPDRPGHPRRGGGPNRRLRAHPVGAAGRAARSRTDPHPAAAPVAVERARRRRGDRDHLVPVRVAGAGRRVRSPGRGRGRRRQAGESARRRGAVPAHHPHPGHDRDRAPQPLARAHEPRAVRGRRRLPAGRRARVRERTAADRPRASGRAAVSASSTRASRRSRGTSQRCSPATRSRSSRASPRRRRDSRMRSPRSTQIGHALAVDIRVATGIAPRAAPGSHRRAVGRRSVGRVSPANCCRRWPRSSTFRASSRSPSSTSTP